MIDEGDQSGAELREEVNFRGVLPLPADFNPKMVEALRVLDREDGELVFLSDSTLVLGAFDGNRIKRVDTLTSNIKNSKAIFLSVGQSDSDPNPEIAVVWGQDRDISGKGQYTKVFSQSLKYLEKLQEETKKWRTLFTVYQQSTVLPALRLLHGDIGKLNQLLRGACSG